MSKKITLFEEVELLRRKVSKLSIEVELLNQIKKANETELEKLKEQLKLLGYIIRPQAD